MHRSSFGRNPRDSADFLAYPVPKVDRQAVLSWYSGSEVLGYWALRLEPQSSEGLRMQPYPHMHRAGCLSTRAMGTRFPTVLEHGSSGSVSLGSGLWVVFGIC